MRAPKLSFPAKKTKRIVFSGKGGEDEPKIQANCLVFSRDALESIPERTTLRGFGAFECMGDARGLFVVDNGVMYDGGNPLPLPDGELCELYAGEKRSAVYLSGKLCVFPDALAFSEGPSGSLQKLATTRSFSGGVRVECSDVSGKALAPYTQKPESPEPDSLFLDSKSGKLYCFDGESGRWKSESVYLKISAEYLGVGFSVGEYIYIETDKAFASLDGRCHKILALGEHFVVISSQIGYTERVLSGRVVISRPIPRLAFAFCQGERIWGAGLQGDAIYACQKSSPSVFCGDDAICLPIGSHGAFTGGAVLGEYPVFFKENAVYTVVGRDAPTLVCEMLDGPGYFERNTVASSPEGVFFVRDGRVFFYSSGKIECINASAQRLELYDGAPAAYHAGRYYVGTKNGIFVFDKQGRVSVIDTKEPRAMAESKGVLYVVDAKGELVSLGDGRDSGYLDTDREIHSQNGFSVRILGRGGRQSSTLTRLHGAYLDCELGKRAFVELFVVQNGIRRFVCRFDADHKEIKVMEFLSPTDELLLVGAGDARLLALELVVN